ncbi:hypothetical protein Tco_1056576 [Tanacetum coccineum]|uniref:Uncharacterized protein n=1 Tax=Tanacetum coccineum TaxID=301880 RepID=A0ABQ5H3Q4_9ASTR
MGDTTKNIISEQEVANLKAQAKRLFGNENVWVEMHRGMHTTRDLPEEVEEIIGITIEVEPLDKTPLGKFLIKNEEEIFTLRRDDVGIKPDGVTSPAMLYLTRRSLEVIRKFHWTTLGGRSNQLSDVSSPLLSKPGGLNASNIAMVYVEKFIVEDISKSKVLERVKKRQCSVCLLLLTDWHDNDDLQYPSRIVHTPRGDDVAIIKRRRQDLHRGGVRDPATASRRN